MHVLVQPRLNCDAVSSLAHQRPANTGEFRTHLCDFAPLAYQRVVELEGLAFDLHPGITSDIHVVSGAEPRKLLREVRELRLLAGLRIYSVHGVLVPKDTQRVLNREHKRVCSIENLHPVRTFEQIARLPPLACTSKLCVLWIGDSELIRADRQELGDDQG